jgi:hypothetical protein
MNHKQFVKQVKHMNSGFSTIPLSHKKLNSYIAITKAMGMLFGGESGSGKTAMVDSTFVFDIFDHYIKQDTDKKTFVPYWIYRSMERPEFYKRAKWTCLKLWKDYQILIDVPTLLNFSSRQFEISDEVMQIISSDVFSHYFDELNEHLTLYSRSATTGDIYKDTLKLVNQHGRLVKKMDEQGVERTEYVYNDDKVHFIHVTDHLGKLLRTTGQKSDKEKIDSYSRMMSNIFRDLYQGIYIDVSQLNRNIRSMDRLKLTDLDVKSDDFKESSEPYENADIVFGMLNPYKLGMEMYPMDNGYDISKTIDVKGRARFRSIKILKNSYGADDIRLAYRFLGENGYITELPKADQMNNNPSTGRVDGAFTWWDRTTLKGYNIDSKYRKS